LKAQAQPVVVYPAARMEVLTEDHLVGQMGVHLVGRTEDHLAGLTGVHLVGRMEDHLAGLTEGHLEGRRGGQKVVLTEGRWAGRSEDCWEFWVLFQGFPGLRLR
jgi:hypothetical protein